MFLKALEVQGFKSFADKTVLSFDGDITAIVGPNGSGKSNISDAVQWVLGEQSTKNLRGTKMEDVIFGGTEKRSQMGFAEATLILDNTDHSISFDSTEVSITRRYYRSGESEYYINRKAARLRDINELFMDTGLGKEGYSNIGQGKIDSILSLKSTDRRDIFEEAAGISKYRHRKEETERKLEATDNNLLRINDKISEIEYQLEPLREQAKKAEKYLELSAQCKDIEVSLWVDELNQITVSYEKAESDCTSAGFILNQYRDDLNALYEKMETASVAVMKYDESLEVQRVELAQLANQCSEHEGQIKLCEAEIASNEKNIESLNDDLSSQNLRTDSITDKMETQKHRITENLLQIDAFTIQLNQLRSENDRLIQNESGLNICLSDLQTKLQQSKEARISLDTENKAIMENISNLETRSDALCDDQADLKDQIALQYEISHAKEKEADTLSNTITSLSNSLSGYSLKMKMVQEKLNTAKASLDSLTAEYNEKKSRLDILREMEREHVGFSQSVKAVLSAAKTGVLRNIIGPVSEILHTDEKWTVAIETAAGNSLQNIIVKSSDDGSRVVSYLKKNNLGRATFLPLDTLSARKLEPRFKNVKGYVGVASDLVTFAPEYRIVAEYILGRTLVFEDLDYALAFSKEEKERYRIVTLDGQLKEASGAITGGSVVKTSGIISRANEISRLNAECEKIDQNKKAKEESFGEISRKYEAVSYEAKSAEEHLTECKSQLLIVQSAVAASKTLIASLSSRLSSVEAEQKNNLEQIAQYKSKNSSNHKTITNLLESEKEIENKLLELQNLTAHSSEEYKKLNDRISEISTKIAALLSENNSLTDNIQNLQTLLNDLQGDAAGKTTLITAYKERIAKLSDSILQEKKTILQLKELESEKKSVYETDLSARNQTEADKMKASLEIRDTNENVLKMEREFARLQQKKTALETNEKILTDKLWDCYELTRSTAASQVIPLESKTSAQKTLNDLHRKISALGTPNINAIEDYKRVNERFEYLDSQRQDVEQAKSELSAILRNISKEMTVTFTEEFKKIADYFSATFVEMFGGGMASLSLENPEEPLSCGIEIKVQPPGKQLKTITLLSGGEKAFVAISLYFAILKVRPSPFCILDEIDAALDDSNVSRFSSYLRGLSKSTQFIVITHRRGTMEEADVLYGVTMQERGVSRMLQLNMQELTAELGITE